jgi:5S rRNA maturation endonuclease (ribonuclease M5)
MLLQKKERISWHDARAIIEGSMGIDEASRGSHRYSEKAKKLTRAEIEGAPWQEWQWSAEWFYKVCKAALWSEQGEKALAWLRERGISNESIDKHSLGFNPADATMDWGTGEKITLNRGIVIPYLGQEQVWKIEIRRATHKHDQRYRTVKGSANALYNYEALEYLGKAVICEGVFDCLVMGQALDEAGITDVIAVATGSTNGSYGDRWVMKLNLCDNVVIAMDSDEGGNKAALWWQERMSTARRWKPSCGDVNAMYTQDRAGLINAIACGFVKRDPCKVCERSSVAQDCYGNPWCSEHFPKSIEDIESLEEYCFECGDDLDTYDCYGRAWCAAHKPGEAALAH